MSRGTFHKTCCQLEIMSSLRQEMQCLLRRIGSAQRCLVSGYTTSEGRQARLGDGKQIGGCQGEGGNRKGLLVGKWFLLGLMKCSKSDRVLVAQICEYIANR